MGLYLDAYFDTFKFGINERIVEWMPCDLVPINRHQQQIIRRGFDLVDAFEVLWREITKGSDVDRLMVKTKLIENHFLNVL